MDNEHDFVFEGYMSEGASEPLTLEEFKKQAPPTDRELAEKRLGDLRKGCDAKPDALDIEAVIHQQRAVNFVKAPQTPGQVFTPSGAPLSKTTEAVARDPLLRALEVEVESDLPPLVSARELGREPLRPGPALNLEASSTSEILEAVAVRCGSEGGRQLAKRLAGTAAELGV